MDRRTIAMLAGTALVVSACGSTAPAIVNPRPAAPVNLTVFIDNSRVSVSPANVGAGPVEFIITNQAAQTESLAVLPAGASAGQPLANTGPINPQGTAQVTVNFSSPGQLLRRHRQRRRRIGLGHPGGRHPRRPPARQQRQRAPAALIPGPRVWRGPAWRAEDRRAEGGSALHAPDPHVKRPKVPIPPPAPGT